MSYTTTATQAYETKPQGVGPFGRAPQPQFQHAKDKAEDKAEDAHHMARNAQGRSAPPVAVEEGCAPANHREAETDEQEATKRGALARLSKEMRAELKSEGHTHTHDYKKK